MNTDRQRASSNWSLTILPDKIKADQSNVKNCGPYRFGMLGQLLSGDALLVAQMV